MKKVVKLPTHNHPITTLDSPQQVVIYIRVILIRVVMWLYI